MVFITFQYASLRSDWYLLTTLSEYVISGLVHSIAYMIELTVKVYGNLLMHSLSSEVVAQSFLERVTPKLLGDSLS